MDTIAHGDPTPTGRRRLLRRAAGLGGVIAALPVIARTASASAPSTSAPATTSAPTTTSTGSTTTAAPTTAAQTTTTAPPFAPTADDVTLLSFVQSLELAAAELYAMAGKALAGKPADAAAVVGVLTEHHRAYADSLSGLLGRRAPNTANKTLVDELSKDFSSASEVLIAAGALEDTLVATHLEALTELKSTDAAALLASILTVEARHNSALLLLTDSPAAPQKPAETTNAALSPRDYPVEG